MLSHGLIKKFQIFSKYQYHPIEEFEYLLKTERRYIYTDIANLNEVLRQYQYDEIYFEQDRLVVPNIAISELLDKMLPNLPQYLFYEERLDMIILYILLSKEAVSINHLRSLLRMSKNSVLSDLKRIKQRLHNLDSTLVYDRQNGYLFSGSALTLRHLLENSIDKLMTFVSGKWLIQYVLSACQIKLEIETISSALIHFGKKHKVHFISEKAREVSYLIAILKESHFPANVSENELSLERVSFEALKHLVDDFIVLFPQLAKEYLFILSRLIGCVQGDYRHAPDQTVVAIMEAIIDSVNVNTGLDFKVTSEFKQNLYAHLFPAYYRLLFDIELINPLKAQIKAEYRSLFYLIKRSLEPLEESLGKPISEDEVAYFTIHFGGYLTTRQPTSQRVLTALSICPNGVSSSLIMQSELKQLFPVLTFKEIHQLEKVEQIDPTTYDLIFSTVYFDSVKPVYLVQPLMNAFEKTMLKKQVCEDFQLPIDEAVEISDLLNIIEKFAIIQDRRALIDSLSNYVIGNQQAQTLGGIALLDLLTIDFVQQAESAESWQAAIKLAAQPLLNHGYILPSYIDGMIDSINQLGAYIVLAPKVAVPHASPECGVNQLGFSLLQLRQPVDFDLKKEGDSDKQVQLIFVLAAVDSTAHLKALQQLAIVLEDEVIEAMIQACSKTDILEIIQQAIEKEEN